MPPLRSPSFEIFRRFSPFEHARSPPTFAGRCRHADALSFRRLRRRLFRAADAAFRDVARRFSLLRFFAATRLRARMRVLMIFFFFLPTARFADAPASLPVTPAV